MQKNSGKHSGESEEVTRSCSAKKSYYGTCQKFTRNHLFWNLFFNKVTGYRPVTLSRRDSGTVVFLRLFRITSLSSHSERLLPVTYASVKWISFKVFVHSVEQSDWLRGSGWSIRLLKTEFISRNPQNKPVDENVTDRQTTAKYFQQTAFLECSLLSERCTLRLNLPIEKQEEFKLFSQNNSLTI